ncbi:MAG: aminotransferase class I/II-fold pyridoxal phosphate-dependent enzyme [Fimbriimonadaceae bacterium]|nr:aminotransferase class I/II-fold pyridoxal phosphate-dependent enzyme [Fimbriimonadaceae bacterium]
MMDAAERRTLLAAGPFNPPWRGEPLLGSSYDEQEIEAAVAAMRDSLDPHVGFGFSASPIPEFEQEFAAYVGAKHAVAVNSAGPGLDIMMRYLNLQPGDEVIVPACNYQAAPLAVYGAGGQVVWGEVDEATLQLDPADVETKMSSRTRAIFPVHMNGLSAPIAELEEVAARHPHPQHGPVPVIGDAARACGGGYRGGKIGGFGFATVYSFHTMKNMTTLGEGGMITTDSDAVEQYARSVRMYGNAVEAWGTSNVMTKVQAAVGRVQLRKLDGFIADRRRVAAQRNELLADLPELILPAEPADCVHSYYLYTCQVVDAWAGPRRDALIQLLGEEYGLYCVIANPPVYQGRRILREHTPGQSCPRSEALAQRLLCVPIHPSMSPQVNAQVCAAVIDAVERLR